MTPAQIAKAQKLEAGIGLDMPVAGKVRVTAHLGAFVPFGGSPSLQARAGVSMAF